MDVGWRTCRTNRVLKRDRSLEFLVYVADSTVGDFTQNPEGALEGARGSLVAHVKGQLRKTNPIRVGPYPGQEWEITVPDRQAVMRSRMLIGGPRRFFSISVAMPADGSEDQPGQQFLDSFRPQ